MGKWVLPKRAVVPKKMHYSPYQLSLWDQEELDRCAVHIREDLRITKADFDTVMDLAVIHGGRPQPAAPFCTGETEGEVIRVNLTLPPQHLTAVVLHEIVHRLANSDRWVYLNPVKTNLPRRVFLELLAVRVTATLIH